MRPISDAPIERIVLLALQYVAFSRVQACVLCHYCHFAIP
jgi:hypothetical protein